MDLTINPLWAFHLTYVCAVSTASYYWSIYRNTKIDKLNIGLILCNYTKHKVNTAPPLSWQVTILSDSTDISRLSRSQKIHCHLHKGPSLAPILRQMNPVHILIFYSLKVHFNTVSQSIPTPLRFRYYVYISVYTCPPPQKKNTHTTVLFSSWFY
jgi:hypothetical protein